MTAIAYVLTSEARLPALQRIREIHASLRPDGTELVVTGTPSEHALGFRLGAAWSVVAMAMPAPVPNGEAEAAAGASIAALGGKWTPSEHRAHHVVVLQGESATIPPDVLADFTRVVAAVAQASEALGVYWGPGGVTHPTGFFVEMAKGDLRWPLPAWLGVSMAGDENRVDLLTNGLRQFQLAELRVTAPRKQGSQALETLFDLAFYALDRGAIVPDGDTVGSTASDRNRVRHEPSPIDASQTVWRVDLEQRSVMNRLRSLFGGKA